MILSSKTLETSSDQPSIERPEPYKYDLRLEISVKKEGSTIPVVAIFYDLVRRLKEAADAGAPVVILTATNKIFQEQKEMPSEEFQKAFRVDNIEGKISKVLLGFKMQSLTKLSDLKRRILHTFLVPHNLFLRPHTGGFEHGVKSYSFGFLKHDHPDHPDISSLNQRFARIIADAWKQVDKAEKTKWRNDLPAAFFGSTGLVIPIHFTKERATASFEDKEKISTFVLMVSTPTKYGKLLKTLLDIAIMGKKLNNLIPYALSRDNPGGYYYMLAQQARFIENHRNIPILGVPNDANIQLGAKDESLMQVLNGNQAIHRVAYDPQQNKYHVSTTAAKYREVHQWLTKMLADHKFPYDPQIRSIKFGYQGNGTGISYSDLFKDAISVASDSYAASTLPSTKSNAWKNRPPLAISYDLNDVAFPTLPTIKKPAPGPTSTTSETFDADTIQSAISTAIKKLEDKHHEELAKLKLEMQRKIDEVTDQMRNLGKQVAAQTYQALVKDESPLVTKADHANLQCEMSLISTQLSTIIKIFQDGTFPQLTSISAMSPQSPARFSKRAKPNSTPEKEIGTNSIFTQDPYDSSATSDPEEVMEGCED